MVDVDGSCLLHRRLGKPVAGVSEADRDRTKRIVYSIIYGVGKLADSDRKITGSRVVSVLDSGAERPGFKSQPRRCRVTVVGKLFTPIVPLFTKH